MKVLVRAWSGEHGAVYMALVEFDPALIRRVQNNWPEIDGERPESMTFWSNIDWLEGGNMAVIDILDQGPVRLDDDAEIEGLKIQGFRVDAAVARVECSELVVGEDAFYWKCIIKHTDIHCETATLSLYELMDAGEHLKEIVDDQGRS